MQTVCWSETCRCNPPGYANRYARAIGAGEGVYLKISHRFCANRAGGLEDCKCGFKRPHIRRGLATVNFV